MKRFAIKEFCKLRGIKQNVFAALFPDINHKQAIQNFIRSGYEVLQGNGGKVSIVKIKRYPANSFSMRKVDGQIETTEVLHTTILKD